MSSAAHRFRRVEVWSLKFEFWIFVLIFSTVPACRKQQQILDIQNSTRSNRWVAEDIEYENELF